MSETCKSCKWWDEGDCQVAAYSSGSEMNGGHPYKTVPKPLMIAYDCEQYAAGLQTEANFGCIHHTPKETNHGKPSRKAITQTAETTEEGQEGQGQEEQEELTITPTEPQR